MLGWQATTELHPQLLFYPRYCPLTGRGPSQGGSLERDSVVGMACEAKRGRVHETQKLPKWRDKQNKSLLLGLWATRLILPAVILPGDSRHLSWAQVLPLSLLSNILLSSMVSPLHSLSHRTVITSTYLKGFLWGPGTSHPWTPTGSGALLSLLWCYVWNLRLWFRLFYSLLTMGKSISLTMPHL